MEKEYDILVCLEKEEEISQRDIAYRTGLSLGTVNLLLGKMVKKGLVKIDRLNARSLRYILTPQGTKKKALLTYKFIKNSYQYIRGITLSLENAIKEKNQKDLDEVFLIGEKDEVYKLVVNLLSSMDINYEFIRNPGSFKELLKEMDEREGKLVILWDVDLEDLIPENLEYINVLKLQNPS